MVFLVVSLEINPFLRRYFWGSTAVPAGQRGSSQGQTENCYFPCFRHWETSPHNDNSKTNNPTMMMLMIMVINTLTLRITIIVFACHMHIIHICIHIYIYTYIYIHMYNIYIYTCICMCVCVFCCVWVSGIPRKRLPAFSAWAQMEWTCSTYLLASALLKVDQGPLRLGAETTAAACAETWVI